MQWFVLVQRCRVFSRTQTQMSTGIKRGYWASNSLHLCYKETHYINWQDWDANERNSDKKATEYANDRVFFKELWRGSEQFPLSVFVTLFSKHYVLQPRHKHQTLKVNMKLSLRPAFLYRSMSSFCTQSATSTFVPRIILEVYLPRVLSFAKKGRGK